MLYAKFNGSSRTELNYGCNGTNSDLVSGAKPQQIAPRRELYCVQSPVTFKSSTGELRAAIYVIIIQCAYRPGLESSPNCVQHHFYDPGPLVGAYPYTPIYAADTVTSRLSATLEAFRYSSSSRGVAALSVRTTAYAICEVQRFLSY